MKIERGREWVRRFGEPKGCRLVEERGEVLVFEPHAVSAPVDPKVLARVARQEGGCKGCGDRGDA